MPDKLDALPKRRKAHQSDLILAMAEHEGMLAGSAFRQVAELENVIAAVEAVVAEEVDPERPTSPAAGSHGALRGYLPLGAAPLPVVPLPEPLPPAAPGVLTGGPPLVPGPVPVLIVPVPIELLPPSMDFWELLFTEPGLFMLPSVLPPPAAV